MIDIRICRNVFTRCCKLEALPPFDTDAEWSPPTTGWEGIEQWMTVVALRRI